MSKRRCAGCNRVIDGRPNKLYCSDACQDRAKKRRKRGDTPSPLSASIPSVVRGSNGVLVPAAARLGYLDGPVVLDLTYGRGAWWTRYRPNELVVFDGDFTDTGFMDGSVPIVCFDPPYISTGTKAKTSIPDFYDRYGIGELSGWQAIRKLMEVGLGECARIVAASGFVLLKCMDYVESGRKVWNTVHFAHYGESCLGLALADRFVHVTGGGAQPQTNLDGTPREQKHSRGVHSELLV